MIYADRLVSISDSEITFHHYYFPTGKKKVVSFSDIENIVIKKPTIWNGKWRFHGTGTFKTWYPMDMDRPHRDRIFFATLKSQWIHIGFTVENADHVEAILREKRLIK